MLATSIAVQPASTASTDSAGLGPRRDSPASLLSKVIANPEPVAASTRKPAAGSPKVARIDSLLTPPA
jgi:hypothetical protein